MFLLRTGQQIEENGGMSGKGWIGSFITSSDVARVCKVTNTSRKIKLQTSITEKPFI